MQYDVVIVGAGPAGLSAAIRLKQLGSETGREIAVCVIEKGSEVGAHILSGAVIDPKALDELIPDWKVKGAPLTVAVTENHHWILTGKRKWGIPHVAMPPFMNNKGTYTLSLGNLCRWLAGQAEELGVEIFPGFAAAEVLFNEDGSVKGVATGDMGVARDGTHRPDYQPGIELHARYTLLAEGARGHLTKELTRIFGLRDRSGPQHYGLGVKELWDVPAEKHKPGRVIHTQGWPLEDAWGGGFLYHQENNQVALGFVVALDYENPYLSPFEEFQRWKLHPAIRAEIEGGRRVSYGARAINEGGWQSVPELVFPGGALIGCSAGFVNVPRIKGSHNAVLSGMMAAEHVAEAIATGRAHDEISGYDAAWRGSPIGRDLKRVRNVKPLWSRFGTWVGIGLGGLDMWMNQLFGISLFGTLGHGKTDAGSLEPADKHRRIDYPKPDGVLTFDRLSSVFLSNTNHDENQPVHLKVLDMELQKRSEYELFSGPSTRYCPAGVYEWVDAEGNSLSGGPGAADKGGEVSRHAKDARFVINAQNCVHCKTCDIKDPNQNINWVPPQGGEGPVYIDM
jgi:electron-transferring-flavoprotein dehydrogenase